MDQIETNAGYKYFMDILEPHDISLHPDYPKSGENVKPVWFVNDYGKQITFLIND